MLALTLQNNNNTKKLSFLIFVLVFTVFLFTSDAHRYTIDEFLGQEMSYHMVIMEPDPNYIEGESKFYFNAPIFNPWNTGEICANGILCYPISVFYSITQVPFIAINHYFPIIDQNTLVLTIDDFAHPHYNFWRNSQNADIVFMELFYGPFLSASLVMIFFLICIEQKFSRSTSVILTFLLAFSTLIWAYSNTSLNVLPTGLFLLVGYMFYKKFQRLNQKKFLLFCSMSLGFSFLIRPDAILFIIPIWFSILISTLKRNKKINSIFIFSTPLLFSYFISKLMPFLLLKQSSDSSVSVASAQLGIIASIIPANMSEIIVRSAGLLFSPGIGLFIFAPIFLTIFFSFPDFFRKNKSDCILFISFFIFSLVFHVSSGGWHGLVGWGPRYLVLVIPFLLIPLGASIEQRDKRLMFTIIIILGILGAFINISYVIQDVSWFVWGSPGGDSGLYGIATGSTPLYLHPNTIWTFQYSQLTHSILLMFEDLHHDIYLLHVFGTFTYVTVFASTIGLIFILYLLKIFKKK
ncbi:glycosyltransferase family 39 protein [Nitrosopumilus sp.]|nr:glycosyltransferase family 39 protein [Nitrosopumilus sp.]